MLLAAWMMFRPPNRSAAADDEEDSTRPRQKAWTIMGEGLIVGVLTGLVGVGGGFLIVPALVILGRLPMRLAVGTSLVVIALKSFSGFFKYLDVLDTLEQTVSWETIAAFVAVGVLGSLLGRLISGRLDPVVLRRGFAGFLLVMGIFVLGMEGRTMMEKRSARTGSDASTQSLAVLERVARMETGEVSQ